MNYLLSPSLLSADFTKVGDQIKLLEQANTPYLHLDVMDGVFVPNISFGMPVIKSIRKATKMVFDVHLMIVEPEKYIEAFQKAGADLICFHLEATKEAAKTIEKIKSLGIKAAIAVKPKTDISEVFPYLENLDMVLVMTVEPGFGGQKFMADQLDKIKELVKVRAEKNLSFDIEVDGGITVDNVPLVLEAGANVIVAGSAVLGKADIKKAAEDFISVFKEYENR